MTLNFDEIINEMETELDYIGDNELYDDDYVAQDAAAEDFYYEDDGQPTEYEEWQDVYGGDDWDHGQYDEH